MLNHSMRSMGVDMQPSQQQEPYHRGGDPYGRGGPPPHLQQVPELCGRPWKVTTSALRCLTPAWPEGSSRTCTALVLALPVGKRSRLAAHTQFREGLRQNPAGFSTSRCVCHASVATVHRPPGFIVTFNALPAGLRRGLLLSRDARRPLRASPRDALPRAQG